jgi:hypothetical protein
MIQRLLILCLLAASFAAQPARADRDAVQFGSNIDVARESTVEDAICFFCSVNVEGKVTGDVVVFFGNVHIAGDTQHDVVNFFGRVSAENNTQIGDDLVSIFGLVRLGENVTVNKDLVSLFGGVRAASTATVSGSRVIYPAWLFWLPLLFIALVVFVLVREYRTYRHRLLVDGYPFPPKQ